MFGGVKGWVSAFSGQSCFAHLLDLIYPESCPGCAQPLRVKKFGAPVIAPLCEACRDKIQAISGPCCPRCAIPQAFNPPPAPGLPCADCLEDPPCFQAAFTPYAYEAPLSSLIQALKYKRQTRLAPFLAELLFQKLGGIRADVLVAVPLHPARLRAREFNQSLLLAKALSHLTGWPLDVDHLRRTRNTASQVGLSKQARKDNIQKAFAVSRPSAFKGRRLLLLDDVYTTGATLREGARALMLAGAKSVAVAAPVRMLSGKRPL